jgi:hypothetical protein
MTAKIQSIPVNLLDEDFDPDNLHPADLEQIIIAAYDEYPNVSGRYRKKYREKYNELVNLLGEKRGERLYNYLK